MGFYASMWGSGALWMTFEWVDTHTHSLIDSSFSANEANLMAPSSISAHLMLTI